MILTPDNEYAAVLDACVLYPMPLCDTLLRLAEEPSFYRPLWSDQILQEVGETLLKKGYSEAQRDRRLDIMRQHFPEALVEVPGELVAAMGTIPDLKDCHVLAAAIAGKANAIVTQNTKHFLPECLKRYGVLCQNADDFLVHQYCLGPEQILEKLDGQASDIKQERAALMENLSKAAPRFSQLIMTGNFQTNRTIPEHGVSPSPLFGTEQKGVPSTWISTSRGAWLGCVPCRQPVFAGSRRAEPQSDSINER